MTEELVTSPLRPHLADLGEEITNVLLWPAGGFVVSTRKGVFFVDDGLARGAKILDQDAVIKVLPGGRLLLGGAAPVVWKDGERSSIAYGTYARQIWPTDDGFILLGADRVLFDRSGTRIRYELGERYVGAGRWRDGLAIADKLGLLLLDGEGREVAKRGDVYLTSDPVACGDRIVVAGLSDELHVFGANAELRRTVPRRVDKLAAFGGGALLLPRREYHGERPMRFELVTVEGDEIVTRWHFDARGGTPDLVREWLVVRSDDGASILDAEGKLVGRVEDVVGKPLPFGDGIAFLGQRSLWWRPGRGLEALDYDGDPRASEGSKDRLIAYDGTQLLLWRPDVQGPEPEALVTDLPLGREIVVDGARMTILEPKRFALLTIEHGIERRRSPKYQSWRELTSRDEAAAILERLVARRFEGPLPALPEVPWHQRNAALMSEPLTRLADLIGLGMFNPSALDPKLLDASRYLREAFFEELAHALETRARLLIAAVRAAKVTLAPPWPVPGYDYLGAFETSGALIVSDPSYLRDRTKNAPAPLLLRAKGRSGTWHAFVRNDKNGRTAELVVAHEEGLSASATKELGLIGVDSGMAGVFDAACPTPDYDVEPYGEGTFEARGAIASSGLGDGGYSVFAGRAGGLVVKLRLSFLDPKPDEDRCMALEASAVAKPYAASMVLAVGDPIEHPKFGVGLVSRVTPGKAEVRFSDGTRTLLQGKK